MDHIPIEVVHVILLNLKLGDIRAVAETSATFTKMCKDERLWKRMVEAETRMTKRITSRCLFILPSSKARTKLYNLELSWLDNYKVLTRSIYCVSYNLKEDASFFSHAFHRRKDAIKFAWVNYFRDSNVDWEFIDFPLKWGTLVKDLDETHFKHEIKKLTQGELAKHWGALLSLTSEQFLDLIQEYFGVRTRYKQIVLSFLEDEGICSCSYQTVSIKKTQIF